MGYFIQSLLAFVKLVRWPIATIAVASGLALFAPQEWLSFLSLRQEIADNRATVGIAFFLSMLALILSAIQTLWQTLGRPILLVAVDQWVPDILERRKAKRIALKNISEPTYAGVLRFLKSNNLKRIPVGDSQLLSLMEKDHLLKKDGDCSISTYYTVPEYVWKVIDERLKDYPIPRDPPWLPPPEWVGRIAPIS